jgi:hypothetical protein
VLLQAVGSQLEHIHGAHIVSPTDAIGRITQPRVVNWFIESLTKEGAHKFCGIRAKLELVRIVIAPQDSEQ